MFPDMSPTMYNEYVTGERDYYSEQEMREWMYAEYYNEDNIVDIDEAEADV
jgi:hypothetical protein